jgi:DNA-binding transcriptional regulator YhcF (GntR family)
MAFDPLDKRPLYQKVVDEITEMISSGQLKERERVPSANEIAERYEVASMTAQRALRELQQRGVIYGVAGKGNFVHPDAPVFLQPLAMDIQSPEQYAQVRDRVIAEMDDGMEVFREKFSAAEAAGDVEAMVAAKDALDNVMRRASPQIAELTMHFHQMRIRGVLLGPEVEREAKDGNRARSHLHTKPGADSNIEGPWPTREEHPEDDA